MKKLFVLASALCLSAFAQAQWQMRSASPTTAITELNALNEDTLFASASGEGLLRSVNGGQSWDTLTFPNVGNFKVHFLNARTGFIAGYSPFAIGPTCFKTVDAGQTWQPMYDTIGGGDYFYKVRFVNKDTGFVSNMGKLSRTTDGGATFTHLELSTEYNYITNIHFISQTTGFVSLVQAGNVSNVDIIFKTTDCGLTWTEVYNQSSGPQMVFVYEGISQMQFPDPLHGFAVATGSPGKILKTTDGGNTWLVLGTNLDMNDYFITDIHFVNTQTGYLAYGQRIYKTTDGGLTWTLQHTTPDEILVQEIHMLNEVLGFASGHALFKTTNGGNTTSLNGVPARKGGFNLYPNPSTGRVYIQNERQTPVNKLTVYAIDGKACLQYQKGNIPAVVSMEGLANGTYFFAIETEQAVYTGQVQLRY